MLTDEQKGEIKEAARGGELSCAKIFQFANEYGVTLNEIGDFCNREKIKVKNCQLGCFK